MIFKGSFQFQQFYASKIFIHDVQTTPIHISPLSWHRSVNEKYEGLINELVITSHPGFIEAKSSPNYNTSTLSHITDHGDTDDDTGHILFLVLAVIWRLFYSTQRFYYYYYLG